MKFFKQNGKIRVQIYPKVVEDKDHIKPAEQRVMEADNISPPILSEGNTPIYKEIRIDEEDKENK